MSDLYPDDDETRKLALSIRLSGKNIYEWKEDSETFLQNKLDAEEKNYRLNVEIATLGNDNYDLRQRNKDLDSKNAQLTTDNAQLKKQGKV